MCTVTILPAAEAGRGARMACNRDEQRTRPAALPPVVRQFGERWAILPLDPLSGGTWVAVSDVGLAFTLLNVNLPADQLPPGGVGRSPRGGIIPELLSCRSFAEVVEQAAALQPKQFPPFRLVVTDGTAVLEVRSDGCRQTASRGPLDRPVFFTSSGLGDHLVEGPRRRLFEATFSAPDEPEARQAAFHLHQWPDRPELSVYMSRSDARTVSHTVVDLGDEFVRLAYTPYAPDSGSRPTVLALPRTHLLASIAG